MMFIKTLFKIADSYKKIKENILTLKLTLCLPMT